jgi:hypothetical protein
MVPYQSSYPAMSVFCEVNPLLSRLHHERISFRLRLRSAAKTLKRRLCLAGSVLSSHPSGQVWFHPFFHHLLSIDSLQNDCLSDSKIWSDFNDKYIWLFNAPANTQSVNDYCGSVPTEACVIKCEMRAPPTFQSDQRQGCDSHPNLSIDLSNAAICRTTCSVELVPR